MEDAIKVQPKPNGEGVDIVDLVKNDLEMRAVIGEAKYGQRLKAFNGRSSLVDAYQEVLDLSVYLKQKIKESEQISLEMIVSDIYKNWIPKTKTELQEGRHGSDKGEIHEVTWYYDESKCEWTFKDWAFAGYLRTILSPIIKNIVG